VVPSADLTVEKNMPRRRPAQLTDRAGTLSPVRAHRAPRITGARALAFVLLGMVAAAAPAKTAQAGNVTYSINSPPNPAVGGSIQGTITTDGATGNLSASDFINWNINVYDTSHTLLLTLDSSNSNTFVSDVITATPTELQLPEPVTGSEFSNLLVFREGPLGAFLNYQWFVGSSNANIISESSDTPAGGTIFFSAASTESPFVIASVPEPSTIVLGAIGTTSLFLYGCWRRLDRHRQRRKARPRD
jgi:hypothetical protein